MASQQQIFETKILLNSEQAKAEIDKLSKKVDELKKKWSLIAPLDVKALEKINKEIKKEEAKTPFSIVGA